MGNLSRISDVGYVQGVSMNSLIPLYPFCIIIGILISIITVAYF
jgi:hypothetical protein